MFENKIAKATILMFVSFITYLQGMKKEYYIVVDPIHDEEERLITYLQGMENVYLMIGPIHHQEEQLLKHLEVINKKYTSNKESIDLKEVNEICEGFYVFFEELEKEMKFYSEKKSTVEEAIKSLIVNEEGSINIDLLTILVLLIRLKVINALICPMQDRKKGAMMDYFNDMKDLKLEILIKTHNTIIKNFNKNILLMEKLLIEKNLIGGTINESSKNKLINDTKDQLKELVAIRSNIKELEKELGKAPSLELYNEKKTSKMESAIKKLEEEKSFIFIQTL